MLIQCGFTKVDVTETDEDYRVAVAWMKANLGPWAFRQDLDGVTAFMDQLQFTTFIKDFDLTDAKGASIKVSGG